MGSHPPRSPWQRARIDTDGNLIQSTSYTPFGEVMTREGEQSASAGSAKRLGFTGEQRDATGLMYLRARYYAPERGAFLSRDAWEGDTLNPQTFNPYSYVGGNPINIADPSGNCYGPLEWLRSLPIEDRNCIALDQSLHILGSGNYSDGDKRWAGAYVGTWTVGHSYLLVGAGVLGGKAVAASAGPIGNVVRWGQSYLLRHPNVGNALGIGMIAASTVDDMAAVHAGMSGNPAAVGELITVASVDGQLPFADVIAGGKYIAKNIAEASSCAPQKPLSGVDAFKRALSEAGIGNPNLASKHIELLDQTTRCTAWACYGTAVQTAQKMSGPRAILELEGANNYYHAVVVYLDKKGVIRVVDNTRILGSTYTRNQRDLPLDEYLQNVRDSHRYSSDEEMQSAIGRGEITADNIFPPTGLYTVGPKNFIAQLWSLLSSHVH